MGAGALLRVAALPLQAWLSGGAPDLFAALAALEEEAAGTAQVAASLAAQIGGRLVPHPDVGAADRGLALRCRRVLHRGVVTQDAARVAELAARVMPADPLAADLSGLVIRAGMVAARQADLHSQVLAEDRRLLGLPWRLLHDHAAGRHAVGAGDLAVCDDIAWRIAAGELWTTKRMRQRSDYLWRMVRRSSTRATPRGWLAHVAALPVGEGWTGHGPLSVLDRAAVDSWANLDHGRHAAQASTALIDPGVPLAMTPLYRLEPQHLRAWTLAGAQRTRLREVRLRRSGLLDALLALVSDAPVAAARLLDELAGPGPRQREAVTGLLSYLLRLGVLQACVEPRRTLTGWAAQSDTPAIMIGADDFIDVYRQPVTGLDRVYADRLADLIKLALRVGALADTDEPAPGVILPSAITEHPRPLLDIFAECIDHRIVLRRGRAHHHDWPVAHDPRSGYAGLHRCLSARMDGTVPIDLDAATLDRFGAPPADLHWPADALVEPIGGAGAALAYLAAVVPAARLDARFLPALDLLGAQVGQQVAYRTFLDALGGAIEILVPPLSQFAANAVRRPAYTALWAGDPDRACYIADSAATYVPLSAITLRRAADQVIAEAEGELIRPVMHTARVAPPPWDTLAELLMLASPQPGPAHWRSLRYTLTGWPERVFVPRITVGGALVLSLAQWRVDRAEFWHRGEPLPAKAAALARLASVRGLPRLVMVATSPHDEPIAADLASLNSIRLFDRVLQRGVTALLLSELPAGRPVRDEASGGASVAELLLRLPVASTPEQAARRAADHLLRLHGQSAGSAAFSGDSPQGRKE